jgi:hypothetical protein
MAVVYEHAAVTAVVCAHALLHDHQALLQEACCIVVQGKHANVCCVLWSMQCYGASGGVGKQESPVV